MKPQNVPDSLFATILVLFAPIKAAAAVIVVLVVIDFITGIMAARKKQIPLTSARMRDTISKLFIFEVALISAFLLETYLMSGLVPAVKVVSAVIGVAEGKSILENLDTLQGGDLFKALIDKLGSSNK